MGEQAADRVTDLSILQSDIEAAAARIGDLVRTTPILELGDIVDGGFDLSLKLEHLQVTGSFKARGAFSALTALDVPEVGVVAASGGNFGAAVAFAAARLSHPATIFVPGTSPDEKIERIRSHGADVRVVDGYYDEARQASEAFVSETGALALHAYDQHEVVAGQGTIGTEIEQQNDPDMVLVAVGGGGLIAGVASWFRGQVKVIAVEPERCSCLHSALEQGRPVEGDVSGVAVSSLGARQIGGHAWAAREWIDDSVVVDDDAIVQTQHWLWSQTRLLVEPAAATPMAALRFGVVRPQPGSRVVVVLSGANVDPASLGGPWR